jgi:hypothetical protein
MLFFFAFITFEDQSWSGTETDLGARLPRKDVFQQPLVLDFGIIAATQDK